MEFTFVDGGITAAQGFTAAGLCCSIKPGNTQKRDVALIYSDVPCSAAAIYTQNLVKGAPVLVTREHLKNGRAQAIIANSGNANTCNFDGIEKAEEMCKIAADVLHISKQDVIVASTGVIGQILPIEPIRKTQKAGRIAFQRGGHRRGGSDYDHGHKKKGSRGAVYHRRKNDFDWRDCKGQWDDPH